MTFVQLIPHLEANLAMIRLSRIVAASGEDMFDVVIDGDERENYSSLYPDQTKFARFQPINNYHLAQLAFWVADYHAVMDLTLESQGEITLLSDFLRGQALWRLGRQDEAIEVWQPLRNIERFFFTRALQAEYDRDYILLEQYSYQQLLIGRDREAAEPAYWFALAMNIIPKIDESPDDYDQTIRKAIDSNLNLERRLLRMGAALTDQRRLELAKESLEPILELENITYWSNFQLGLVYYLLHDHPAAKDQFLSVIKTNPEFGRAHLFLARSFVRMDQRENAIPYYREAIRLLPEVQGLELELNKLIDQKGSDG